MLDLTAFDAVLKDVYQGPLREQLNEETRLLDLFTKGEIDQYEWQGRQMIVPLHKSRNSGVKAAAENGYLPSAGSQGYAKLAIPMKYVYGRIELTIQTIKHSRTDKGAFIRAMDSEQKGIVADISRQRNRMLTGFGRGTLAVVSSGANSTSQDVKDPGGVVGTTNPVRFLKPGMVIAFTDSTGATLRGVRTISSITDADTIVVDSAVNTTTGDLISLATNAAAPGESSYDLEPMGLLGLVDSTTYLSTIHGLDRSSAANAFFRSTIMSSVGTLSPDLIQRGIDNTEEIGGGLIDQFLCHVSVRRELLKLTEADRRYNVSGSGPSNFDAGNKASGDKSVLTHNGIPIRTDKDFPYGILMGVEKKHLIRVAVAEGEWADEDGSILLRGSNKDTFEARYRVADNFLSDKGNSHVRFDGVTATVSSNVYAD